MGTGTTRRPLGCAKLSAVESRGGRSTNRQVGVAAAQADRRGRRAADAGQHERTGSHSQKVRRLLGPHCLPAAAHWLPTCDHRIRVLLQQNSVPAVAEERKDHFQSVVAAVGDQHLFGRAVERQRSGSGRGVEAAGDTLVTGPGGMPRGGYRNEPGSRRRGPSRSTPGGPRRAAARAAPARAPLPRPAAGRSLAG